MAEPGSFLKGLFQEAEVWAPIGQLFETLRRAALPDMGHDGDPGGGQHPGAALRRRRGDDRQFMCFMSTPFNILAPCPVLALPSGSRVERRADGRAIVARTYDDVTAFRLGAALEEVRPWTRLALVVPCTA